MACALQLVNYYSIDIVPEQVRVETMHHLRGREGKGCEEYDNVA
jgi:hypothetical protein